MEKYKCPCCGNYELDEKPGKYGICPVCGWEDDPIQRDDPFFEGGANELSLKEYRERFWNTETEGEEE